MERLCDLTVAELARLLEAMGEPSYLVQQICQWVYEKKVASWDAMSNISGPRRAKLVQTFSYPILKPVRMVPSGDQETYKFLWQLHDGAFVESVLICSGKRRTVCVSSQVGCPAACAFCASGRQGFKRNLAPAEIVEQAIHIDRWLQEREEKVSHIVFMGMGEPLKNYNSVLKAIKILCHPQQMGLSARRITVSTVGMIDEIRKLAREEEVKVNLVLSLHAPNQNLRRKLIPYAKHNPLDELLQATEAYAQATKRDVTYEYTLIAGVNDHPDHAHELAILLKRRQCAVNLIPYNPVEGLKLKRPTKQAVKAFRSVLFGSGIVNTCRYTKGDDIAAACGQLALQVNGEAEKSTGLPVLA